MKNLIVIFFILSLIAFAGEDDKLWDKRHYVSEMEFSPDGTQLAVDGGGFLTIFDPQNGTEIFQIADYTKPTYSPDGLTLYSIKGSKIYVWNTSSWEIVEEIQLENSLYNYEFSSDFSLFVASAQNKGVQIYETTNWTVIKTLPGVLVGWKPPYPFKTPMYQATQASISSDNRYIAYSAAQWGPTPLESDPMNERWFQSTDIYDLQTDQIIKQLEGHKEPKFRPNTNELYTTNIDLWKHDFESNEITSIYNDPSNFAFIFNYNSKYIIIGSSARQRFTVYDIDDMKDIYTYSHDKPGPISVLAISNDDTYIASMTHGILFVVNTSPYLGGISEETQTKLILTWVAENLIIDYSALKNGNIEFTITDITGNTIDLINEGFKSIGQYQTNYNTQSLPIGSYFLTLRINGNGVSEQFQIIR